MSTKSIPVILLLFLSSLNAQNSYLTPWRKGYLDIHFISTGRGNASFILMPDGTTMLIDAGDLNQDSERLTPRVPDSSKTPGQWIADNILDFHPHKKQAKLDYVLITHELPAAGGELLLERRSQPNKKRRH